MLTYDAALAIQAQFKTEVIDVFDQSDGCWVVEYNQLKNLVVFKFRAGSAKFEIYVNETGQVWGKTNNLGRVEGESLLELARSAFMEVKKIQQARLNELNATINAGVEKTP